MQLIAAISSKSCYVIEVKPTLRLLLQYDKPIYTGEHDLPTVAWGSCLYPVPLSNENNNPNNCGNLNKGFKFMFDFESKLN